MSLRLSLIMAGLGCFVRMAHAQIAPLPPVVSELPSPPLVVPISPAPLDEDTRALLDANKIRSFMVPVKNIQPSVMAYWLDPKNHEAPTGTSSAIPSLPSNWVLPTGVNRIVAVDPQKALLIFGTKRGATELMETISFLDRPERGLFLTVPRATFEASLYWIDSLVPTAKLWQKAAPNPRIALPIELQTLSELKTQDRASSQPFILNPAAVRQAILLPFATTLVAQPPKKSPSTRNLSNGQNFKSAMPLVNPDEAIDPGIRPQGLYPLPVASQSEVLLSPTEIRNDSLQLMIGDFGNFGFPATTLALRDGDTLLLSGSAKVSQLKPPSPRFDTFVLAVKVHIVQPLVIPPSP